MHPQEPLFFRRKDYPDVIYRTVEAKLRSIALEIVREHVRGRPMLVGTTSVEFVRASFEPAQAEPVRRLLQIALVRRVWMEANNREEDGRLIPELQQFNEPLEKITPELAAQVHPALWDHEHQSGGTLQPAGRTATFSGWKTVTCERLKKVIQGGVPHQVLNARKHTEESQIIAGAGAFGAVTIATNMAGRGVDIKLGGELAEEVITAVNRVLRQGRL